MTRCIAPPARSEKRPFNRQRWPARRCSPASRRGARRRSQRSRIPRWSRRANISRGPATASPATRRPRANSSPAACRCRRRSGRSTRPTSRRIARPGSAHGPPTSFTRCCIRDAFQTAACSIQRCLLVPTPRSPAPDSDAIFAYLKTVPPVRQANRPHDLKFPFNNRSLILGWRTLYFTEGEYKPDPNQSAEWNRGAYLVEGLGHCGMCHTAINALGGSSESEAFQGGLIPMQDWYAPSLTSDKEAGLGDWSLKDIADLLKTGVSARGAVYGPMAEVIYNSLQYLTDADIQAMAVYLKSLAQGRPPAPATSNIPGSRRQPPGRAGQDDLRQSVRGLSWSARASESRRTFRRSPAISRSRWDRRSIRSAWC